MNVSSLDLLLFLVLPYVAIFVGVVGSVYRFYRRPYTVSSLSSQVLEGRQHFWAINLFHFGVVAALGGHVAGFLFPKQVLQWNTVPLRLYILEATSIALGSMALLGLVLVVTRRFSSARVRSVTSPTDWALLLLLLVQVATGVGIALFYPWGAYWYHASAVPYLKSILTLAPDPAYVAAMPWPIKLHVAGAWTLLLLLPFTRLIHMLAAPLTFVLRKPQVVRWVQRRPAPAPAAAAPATGNALQLILGTGAFAVCFAVFGSVSAMMPIMRKELGLDPMQASIAIAVPILLGSLGRIPLGILTDRYGGRVVFSAVMLAAIIPAAVIGHVASFAAILLCGFFIGIALASFSVGVGFVSGWYPPQKQGTALGIYGAGNIGQSLAAYGSPVLAGALGYVWGFRAFAIVLAVWFVVFLLFARNAPRRTAPKTLVQIAAPLKTPASWRLSLYYFLTFGGFVAMAVYLPTLLTDVFKLEPKDAGLRTALFVLVATAMRPVGGWIADKVGGRVVLTIVFPAVAAAGIVMASPDILVFSAGAIAMGIAIGLGNGAVFKLVPEYFPETVGAVTGLVGAAGGLGGFFPPIVLGMVRRATGEYDLAFVLLTAFALVSLAVIRPKLLALCITPPERASEWRDCSKAGLCPHAKSCAALRA